MKTNFSFKLTINNYSYNLDYIALTADILPSTSIIQEVKLTKRTKVIIGTHSHVLMSMF